VALMALLLAGMPLLWQRRRFLCWYLLFYSAVVIIFPWEPNRYLTPILPVIVLTLFFGYETVSRYLPARITQGLQRAFPILLGLLLLSNILFVAGWVRAGFREGHYRGRVVAEHWEHSKRACDWIRQNTPPNSVVLANASCATYLFTDRRTLPMEYIE